MDWFSDFFSARLKAFFAAFVVGFVPVIVKAFETGFGVDIPGTWEANLQTWLLALFAGLTVNYTSNVPPKA
jgi:uncharacterized metal-binding protein